MKLLLSILLLAVFLPAWSQKKPLDHTVYDSWQSIGEKLLGSDGKTVVYTVNPQEGDGELFIVRPGLLFGGAAHNAGTAADRGSNASTNPAGSTSTVGATAPSGPTLVIPRGYRAYITPDSRYVIGRIRPPFKDSREAKIKKKKPEDMPKDSLFIVDLVKLAAADNTAILKIANVKSFKTPEKNSGWLAYLAEKPIAEPAGKKTPPDSLTQLSNLARIADSLGRVADSLRGRIAEARTKGISVLKETPKKKGGTDAKDAFEEGTVLTLRNLYSGEEVKYQRVKEYALGKKGNVLVMETTRKKDDTLSRAFIGWVKLGHAGPGSLAGKGVDDNRAGDGAAGMAARPAGVGPVDTVIRGFNESKNISLDEDGGQLAFVLERDSAAKALRKFYSCWYYHPGMDSAMLIVGRNTPGMLPESTVSENYELNFSKSGKRLFLGLAPIRPVRDTTVPDFEKAALDVWNYKDDQLQPVQLKNLERDLKKSWLAGWDISAHRLTVYGDEKFPVTMVTAEGDGHIFYTSSDSGKRIEQQWQGFTLRDIYAVDAATGAKKLIVSDLKGEIYPSYTGKYMLIYDERKKTYSIYNSGTGSMMQVAQDIKAPLYDVENDVPDDPNPYGIAGWEKDDRSVYIYDRYNIQRVDPGTGKLLGPVMLTFGKTGRLSYRYVKTDPDEKFIDPAKPAVLRIFDDSTKMSGYRKVNMSNPMDMDLKSNIAGGGPFSFNGLVKADSVDAYIYTVENYAASPDIWISGPEIDAIQNAGKKDIPGWHTTIGPTGMQVSHLNPQQSNYTWGSAELVKWKAYTGRQTEGILYKPEGFDPSRKYPMIVYYYERNSNTLYNYQAPAPTPSRLNIPFFVSRGYLVFVPDIWYKTGHPGQSAYDYVISGVRSLIKKGFVDSTKMGLQGQSWGGYQTAYLITRTNLFAAAWAGAPVVNMFSAYGGIRWESGVNRQMQYEKTQSRIGATIWERPDLYLENSPLFHLPAVKTPLVIMSNDADGAVPWYQGIEFFTAMRRLHKPVWLLQYNGEAHNLVERRNRKDIQIREQQFFDWLLKGEKAPKWIVSGVPATLKGIDYGMGTE